MQPLSVNSMGIVRIFALTILITQGAWSQAALVLHADAAGTFKVDRVNLPITACGTTVQSPPVENFVLPTGLLSPPPTNSLAGDMAVDMANKVFYYSDGTRIYMTCTQKPFYSVSPLYNDVANMMFVTSSHPTVQFGAITGMAAVPLASQPVYQTGFIGTVFTV